MLHIGTEPFLWFNVDIISWDSDLLEISSAGYEMEDWAIACFICNFFGL